MLADPYRSTDARTVLGMPLEPRERVLHVSKTSTLSAVMPGVALGGSALYLAAKMFETEPYLTVEAVFLAVGVAGFVVAAFLWRRAPRHVVVTDQRVALLGPRGRARAVLRSQVDALAAVKSGRREAASQPIAGPFVGSNPGFWWHAEAIEIRSASSRLQIGAKRRKELGPFLTRWAFEPGFAESAPEVPFDP